MYKKDLTIKEKQPYNAPELVGVWYVQGRNLLESFSLDTDFEDFDDGGDLV